MTSPEEVHERTCDFLRDNPDAEDTLQALLDRDTSGGWTFADIDVDSGQFGELVSQDIATKTTDGTYQLTHPQAVRAALAGEPIQTAESSKNWASIRSRVRTAVSPRELAGLFLSLSIVVGARLVGYRAVFRDGYLVSPANDPYFYRYWQAQLLERSSGVTDLGLLANMGGANSRPLTHAVNWWLAEALGGTSAAADTVAAWLPIIAAVALGCVLYLLAKLLTGDSRVGLAAVAFLALAPIHVVYTSAGFLEHRPHQYLWLGILVLALAWLAVDVQRRDTDMTASIDPARGHTLAPKSWAVAGVLALAVGFSAHIWTGAPLTFIPVAIYIAFKSVADVRAGFSPVFSNVPMIGGLAGGSVLALTLHFGLGWQELFVALTSLLVTFGAVGVITLAALAQRFERSPRELLAAEGGVGLLGLALFVVLEPVDPSRIFGRIEALLFREGATEATSLFVADQAYILGPLWRIGISFYFGLLALVVATLVVARRDNSGWLVCVCFGWYYLLLAALQARFGAQLSIFTSLFAGVACVYFLAKVELVRPFEPFGSPIRNATPSISIPEGRKSVYLVGTICLLLVFNLIFIPTILGQVTYSDEQFEAAVAIDAHATEMDRSYPENAVETRWDHIRMYNYFVNGEASSYSSRYEAFLTATHPDEQHSGLRQGGKYVVINWVPGPTEGSHNILFNGLGVGYGEVETTAGRYQPVYIGERVRAFTVVEGAVLNVSGETGETVTASTVVDIDGEAVTYERTDEIEDGTADLRVAHPGEYTVGNTTVTVSENAVYDGDEIRIELP